MDKKYKKVMLRTTNSNMAIVKDMPAQRIRRFQTAKPTSELDLEVHKTAAVYFSSTRHHIIIHSLLHLKEPSNGYNFKGTPLLPLTNFPNYFLLESKLSKPLHFS